MWNKLAWRVYVSVISLTLCVVLAPMFCFGLLYLLQFFPRDQPPSLRLEVCVNDDRGIAAFKSMLNDFAKAQGLALLDISDQTQKSLNSILPDTVGSILREGILNIGLLKDSESVVHVTNFGLKKHQMLITVHLLDLENAENDKSFGDQFIACLEEHWPVKIQPDDKGAFPDESCGP